MRSSFSPLQRTSPQRSALVLGISPSSLLPSPSPLKYEKKGYVKSLFIKSKAESEICGNLWRKLLYGCVAKFTFFALGSCEKPGQILSCAVPSNLNIYKDRGKEGGGIEGRGREWVKNPCIRKGGIGIPYQSDLAQTCQAAALLSIYMTINLIFIFLCRWERNHEDGYQFSKNTTNGPHVDGRRVLLLPQKQLWRPGEAFNISFLLSIFSSREIPCAANTLKNQLNRHIKKCLV